MIETRNPSYDLIRMNSEELQKYLHDEVSISIVDNIDTDDNKRKAADLMSRMTAMISYLTEMEVIARATKRQTKKKDDPDMFNTLLSNEEIFGAYKDICKQVYDNTAKLMTLKRLELDEVKIMSRTT